MANKHEVGRKASNIIPKSTYHFSPMPVHNKGFVEKYDPTRQFDNPYPDRSILHKSQEKIKRKFIGN